VFSPEKMAAGGSGYVVVKALTGSEAHTLVLMETALWMFSAFGVNLLLFMVGLESSIEEMVEAGGRSLMVAVVGVVTPFGLGWGACAWLLPGASTNVYLFISATLCATSVGITARVFKDLGRLQTPEAKIILGAAVIDDVLGLFVLAVVMGVVATGRADLMELGRIALFAALFLGITITFGERLVRLNLRLLRWIRFQGSKVLFPLSVGFVLAWLASEINLASIVGSFAAGLIMNERDFAQHAGEEEGSIRDLLRPLESIFAPIFFILMGMQVDLSSFADWEALGFAAVLTLAAVAGKVICGLPAGGKLDRLSIGLGMIPRGEVGLIFASMGKAMGIMTEAVFSAVVIMVIVTTLVTPLVLRWSLFRGGRGQVPA
ncbi:MAG: cation:proton antiporter, partial [Gemmatimonadota bacterium]